MHHDRVHLCQLTQSNFQLYTYIFIRLFFPNNFVKKKKKKKKRKKWKVDVRLFVKNETSLSFSLSLFLSLSHTHTQIHIRIYTFYVFPLSSLFTLPLNIRRDTQLETKNEILIESMRNLRKVEALSFLFPLNA